MKVETAIAPTRIITGLASVAHHYDVVLCDIWGVVHDGERHFSDAVDALQRFRAKGGAVVLITNAPRPYGPIVEQLDELGVPRNAYDGIVTSGDVTVALIGDMGDKRAYHIGPPRDLTLFDEVRERIGHTPELTTAALADYIICTGLFDDETETPDDYTAMLVGAAALRLPMICANPDIVVHRGTTLLYCAGALAQAYAALGGTVIYAGKPHGPIYARALALAGGGADIAAKARVLAIGDAIATDMRGAMAQGIDGLLVTHGIHRHDLHPGDEIDLRDERLGGFLALVAETPTLAIKSLVW